jgi:dihydropteroate synthase
VDAWHDEDVNGRRAVLRLGRRVIAGPAVMAVVNRTPDSFFDQGSTYAYEAALAAADRAVAAGADIVDIGGVKAGPGAAVDAAEEARRVVGLVAAVRDRHPDVVISVDTWRSEVGEAAAGAGADLLNDAWGGVDPRLAEVAAEYGTGLVCSHAGGMRPRTVPHRVAYADVVREVVGGVTALAERAVAAGVRRDGILVDPAHDFGKNTRHSLELTRRLDALVDAGWPVLVAVSNKDFVGETLALPVTERGPGTMATLAVSGLLGARVFRVHDVAAARRVLHTLELLDPAGRPTGTGQSFTGWKTWADARPGLAAALPPATVGQVERAVTAAARWHGDQRRPTGVPYLEHLLEALEVLVHGAGVTDPEVLAATVLHDVVEDTPVTLAEVERGFGPRVARLVDAVTKPDTPRPAGPEGPPPTKAAKAAVKAAYLRGLRTAPPDARLVKLADRVSNVQELHRVRPAFQRRYYAETVEHVLPMAAGEPWFAQWYDSWRVRYAHLAGPADPAGQAGTDAEAGAAPSTEKAEGGEGATEVEGASAESATAAEGAGRPAR